MFLFCNLINSEAKRLVMGSNMENPKNAVDGWILIFSPVLGGFSMILFLGFLYHGSFQVLRFGFAENGVLLWNGFLSALFFLQHSVMIRQGFKSWISKHLPERYLNALFSFMASIMLLAVVALWQQSQTILLQLQGIYRYLSRGIFVLALVGFYWGVSALKHFDPFGRAPIKDYIRQKTRKPMPLHFFGPYLWVRHPLYFFLLLTIWSCPDLTLDRILFNVLWTAWIFIGTYFEERDLVSEFGAEYTRYQRKVPMLIPWKGKVVF